MYKLLLLLVSSLLLSACSSLPDNISEPSYAFKKSFNTNIEKKIMSANKLAGLKDDEVNMLLLDDGTDAFVARLSLVNRAEQSVCVCTLRNLRLKRLLATEI